MLPTDVVARSSSAKWLVSQTSHPDGTQVSVVSQEQVSQVLLQPAQPAQPVRPVEPDYPPPPNHPPPGYQQPQQLANLPWQSTLQLQQPQPPAWQAQMGPVAMRFHLLEEEVRRINQDKQTQHTWQVAFVDWAQTELTKAVDATGKVSEELQVMKQKGQLQAEWLQQQQNLMGWLLQQREAQQTQQQQMQQMQVDIQRLTETLAHQQEEFENVRSKLQQLQQLQQQPQLQHMQQVPADVQQQTQQSQPVHAPQQQKPFEATTADAPPLVVPDLVAVPENSPEAMPQVSQEELPRQRNKQQPRQPQQQQQPHQPQQQQQQPQQLQQQQQPAKFDRSALWDGRYLRNSPVQDTSSSASAAPNAQALAGSAAQGRLHATQAMPAAPASQATQAEQVTQRFWS